MNGLQFEAVKIAMKQDRDGFVLTLRIHPHELPVEMIHDYVGARYGVAMVRIEDDETDRHYDNRVKQAGMLCRSRDFQVWLCELGHAASKTEEDAVDAVHEICGIKSRTELNGNPDAKANFDKMVEEYEQWKKAEPF